MNAKTQSNMDIKAQAVKSLKWTVFSQIAQISIPSIVMLILARLLTPEDFGVVGVAMIAIGFAQIFQDFGLGKALIQREGQIEESANIVFWSNLGFSIVIYLILFLLSPQISVFFHDPRASNILRVLCIQIILTSLTTVHFSLLQRDFQFKSLFAVRLAPSVIPAVISLPLALIGQGVWALVWGALAGSLAQAILVWRISEWRPTQIFNLKLAREIYGFGIWVFSEMMLSWLIVWGDSIVLGHFLGVDELGVYRVGFTFITLIFSMAFSPIIPIAYSTFSRLQTNEEDLRKSFLKIVKLMALISLPLGVGLALLAKPVSILIFGQMWKGIEIVIAIIGLKLGMDYLVGINPEIYRATGRPDANTKILFANILYYIPIYIFAAPYGLMVFCLARFGVAAISLIIHFFIANKVMKVPFSYIVDCVKSPILASSGMGLFFLIAEYSVQPVYSDIGGFLKLGLILLGGCVIYFAVLWIIDRNLLNNFINIIKSAVKI
jgi:O-antigen/teichoic acid export membrane protein